jgi:glycosyltransferase involved in cell wall biosynthesis
MNFTEIKTKQQQAPPIVSLILPVYNAAPYLSECLSSIVNQDFESFEVIAVNDGSTDDSGFILENYAAKDKRIKIHHFSENRGETKAVQHAWQCVNGTYTARMDNDDICLQNRLSQQVEFLNGNPSITVVGSNMEVFGKMEGRTDLPLVDALIKANFIVARANICNPTAMWRTAWFAEHHVSYGNLKNVSDYGLWVDCMLAGGHFANLSQCLVKHRTHPTQASSDTHATNAGVQSILTKLVSRWYPYLKPEEAEALASICHGVGNQSLTIQSMRDAFLVAITILNDNQSRFNEDRTAVARHVEQRVHMWKNALIQLMSNDKRDLH